jgi:hypothetical protein
MEGLNPEWKRWETMENKRRVRWLNRLEKEDIQKSLEDAVSRAFLGRVSLGLITRTAVLPDKYDQVKLLSGGIYFEPCSEGLFVDDYLKITISGYDSEVNARFEDSAKIRLCEIAAPIFVSYMEVTSSGPEEKHCCLGWQVCGGQCLCDGCPTIKF